MAGIMFRETLASNSKFVALAYQKGSGIKMIWRDSDNATCGYYSIVDSVFPVFLKLAKNNNTFSAYSSVDGENWGNALVTHNTNLTTAVKGFFTSSDSSQTNASCIFNNSNLESKMFRVNSVVFKDGSGNVISSLDSIHYYKGFIDVENIGDEDKDAVISIEVYDSDNKLKRITTLEKVIPRNQKEIMEVGYMSRTASQGNYVKVYVWSRGIGGIEHQVESNEIYFPD